MNLIEQAVDLMARARPLASEPPPPGGSAAATRPAEASLIERAMSTPANFTPPVVAAPVITPVIAPVAAPRNAAAPEPAPVHGHAPAAAPAATAVQKTMSAPLHAQVRPRPAAPPSAPGAAPRTVRVNLEALRGRGFITPGASPTALSQEFRVIKRPLLDNAFGRNGLAASEMGRCIMITSAYSGEGKSFSAINLAMSIAAERDTSVLLIDADVAKPSLPRELGIERVGDTDVDVLPGLMDCLLDPAVDVTDCVLQTNVDRLSVLPAGRRHEHATELLASAAMGKLVDRLASRYDSEVLIFDSPPVLLTTESRVLATHMGQIVMVVEAGRTSREAVVEALAAIGSPEHAGLILNKARETRGGSYGGYGYGYGISSH